MKIPNIDRIHLVGIGGSGMNGIAEVLINQGYRVSGSDLADTEVTRRLERLGGRVVQGHHADHIGDAQVVVISSAVSDDNPEVVAARLAAIPVIPRAEMLAELMRMQYGVAVAGAHGKTTTTSLVATVLGEGGLDPTVVIGGRLNQYGASAKLGKGRYMVAEADESDGSFLRLTPTVAVITNLDREHLDYYGDMDAIRRAFCEFANKVPFFGAVILCLDEPGLQSLLPDIGRRVITYGFTPQADLRAEDLELTPDGATFHARFHGEELGAFSLPLSGRHNAHNAMAAICVALELGVPVDTIRTALAGFTGVARRFERRGDAHGITLIDDYGHHPTEVRAVLAAARESFPDRRLIVVFQPHRYSRTRDQFEAFSQAFNAADSLLVTPVFSAGEAPLDGISGVTLADAVRAHGHRGTEAVDTLEAAAIRAAAIADPGDVVLTLGAGDVRKVGDFLLASSEATAGTG